MKVKEIFKKLVDYWESLDKKRRKVYIISLASCLLVAVIITLVVNRKEYTVLYRDIDAKESAAVVKMLEETKVDYKLDNNAIYVQKKDEPRVRMLLASEGYPKSSLNYDIFTDNINFMTTDFEKSKYELYQLQERLQAAIKTLNDVENAIVTITLPQKSNAVLQEDKIDPTAAVLLKLKAGRSLSKNQVNGIELLVSKSVPGLITDNVSILDDNGNILNNKNRDSFVAVSDDKFRLESQLSDIVKDRIINVLEPVFGKDKISIGVNLLLDFDKKISEKVEYQPSNGNTGVINKSERNYEGTGRDPASGGIPGSETNADIPQYQQETGDEGEEYYKEQLKLDYLVSHIKEQIQKEGASIKDLSVSIMIDKKEMSTEENQNIKNIVANTAGIDPSKVALYNTEFRSSYDEGSAPAPIDNRGYLNLFGIKIPVVAVVLVPLAVLLALSILFIRKRRTNKQKPKPLDIPALMKDEAKALDSVVAKESKELALKNQIKEFSHKNPDVVAQLIRTLVKED